MDVGEGRRGEELIWVGVWGLESAKPEETKSHEGCHNRPIKAQLRDPLAVLRAWLWQRERRTKGEASWTPIILTAVVLISYQTYTAINTGHIIWKTQIRSAYECSTGHVTNSFTNTAIIFLKCFLGWILSVEHSNNVHWLKKQVHQCVVITGYKKFKGKLREI